MINDDDHDDDIVFEENINVSGSLAARTVSPPKQCNVSDQTFRSENQEEFLVFEQIRFQV